MNNFQEFCARSRHNGINPQQDRIAGDFEEFTQKHSPRLLVQPPVFAVHEKATFRDPQELNSHVLRKNCAATYSQPSEMVAAAEDRERSDLRALPQPLRQRIDLAQGPEFPPGNALYLDFLPRNVESVRLAALRAGENKYQIRPRSRVSAIQPMMESF